VGLTSETQSPMELRDIAEWEVRRRLKSLQSRVTSAYEVTDFLKEILDDDAKRAAVAQELGLGGGEAPSGGDAPADGENPEGGEG